MQKTAEAKARDYGLAETVHVGFEEDGDILRLLNLLFAGVDEQGYAAGQILVSSNTYKEIEKWRMFFDDGDDDGLYAAGCEVVLDEEAPDNTLIFIPSAEDHTERKAVVAKWEGQVLSVIM